MKVLVTRLEEVMGVLEEMGVLGELLVIVVLGDGAVVMDAVGPENDISLVNIPVERLDGLERSSDVTAGGRPPAPAAPENELGPATAGTISSEVEVTRFQ
jgi:hypothetical protein